MPILSFACDGYSSKKELIVKYTLPNFSAAVVISIMAVATSCERQQRQVDITNTCKPGETKKSGICENNSKDGSKAGGEEGGGTPTPNDKTPKDQVPKDPDPKDPDPKPPRNDGDTPPGNDGGATPRRGSGTPPGNEPPSTTVPPTEITMSQKANLEVLMSELGDVKLIFKSKNQDKFKEMKVSLKSTKELPAVTEKFVAQDENNIIGSFDALLILNFQFDDQLCSSETQLLPEKKIPVSLTCKKKE